MLVTFSCPAHGDVTMFGDVAIRLLAMMGHSGTVPSALLADDVPAALESLAARIAAEERPPVISKKSDQDDDEPVISLRHRAGPLLELLEAAKVAQCDVMWHAG
jgi:hypothetical protein